VRLAREEEIEIQKLKFKIENIPTKCRDLFFYNYDNSDIFLEKGLRRYFRDDDGDTGKRMTAINLGETKVIKGKIYLCNHFYNRCNQFF
jgi:hypothetical protein